MKSKEKGLAPDHLTEVTEINGFAGHVRAWQRVLSPPSTSAFYSFVAAGCSGIENTRA